MDWWIMPGGPKHGTCKRGPVGWWCSKAAGHGGPCPLRMEWWNVSARVRLFLYARR